MKNKKGLGPLLAVTVLSIGACLAVILAGFHPNLGLDLQGGVSVVLQPVKAGQKQSKVSAEALEQTQRIIETRVNAIGVGEPDITIQGSTIVVQIPGTKDQKKVLDLVGKTAELRFRPVLEPPSSAPPADADQQIADLRKELKIPDGVTTQQIVDEENAASSTTTAPTDTTVPATDTTVPETDTTVPATDATATAAPTTAAPTTAAPTTAASGAGTGGKNSFKGEAARRAATTTTQAPTTTAAPTTVAPTTTVAVTTTTVYVSKNQWGVDVTDPNFRKLYQLDQLVIASKEEVTKPADDKANASVVLYGQPDAKGNRTKYKLGPTLLTGRALESASAGLIEGKWVVNPVFKKGKDGIDLFNAAAAKCNSGATECPPTAPGDNGQSQVGALAVVLDGEVISAPGINAATFARDQIQISGSFTEKSAKDLALVLRYGSLPLELQPQTVQTVSATLGAGALRAGIIAGVIGLGIVVLYVIAYYRLLGLITVGSLILTAAILWAVIGLFGHTAGLALSLAGIVGIIVSIGVSLDSSVVYFENLKEDVLTGRTLRSAVDRSFNEAWGTIVKADVSSLIGAIILYLLSIGPVKGFAFYLALSTVIDLLLAYLFIRPATLLATRSKLGLRPALFGIPVPPQDVPGAAATVRRRGAPPIDENDATALVVDDEVAEPLVDAADEVTDAPADEVTETPTGPAAVAVDDDAEVDAAEEAGADEDGGAR